jgi:hypothetical protein
VDCDDVKGFCEIAREFKSEEATGWRKNNILWGFVILIL